MKKNRNQKTEIHPSVSKSVWVSIALIVLFLVLGVTCIVVFFPENTDPAENSDFIYYYPAKYDEDIFQNDAYMAFERALLYSASGVTKKYRLNEDRDLASVECQFFMRYFDTVIHGNFEDYKDFFVDGYFKSDPKFTMQMIYEPYVMLHSVTEEEFNGETETVYNFEVRYRIFKNNGTFRRGVESNQAVPQVYRLIKTDDSYKIIQILDVEYEN